MRRKALQIIKPHWPLFFFAVVIWLQVVTVDITVGIALHQWDYLISFPLVFVAALGLAFGGAKWAVDRDGGR